MFSLSDEELDRLMDAASMLPTHHRDSFVRSVAGRVADIPNFGIAEIECAIQFVLSHYGIAGGADAFTRSNKFTQLAKGVFR
jgi:hypothetical protein